MRYKGQYEPSELLDPASYLWYPLSQWRLLLDAAENGYAEMSSFHTDASSSPAAFLPKREIPVEVVRSIMLLAGNRIVELGQLLPKVGAQTGASELWNVIDDILQGISATGIEASKGIVWHVQDKQQ